jgi:hypothetical protein
MSIDPEGDRGINQRLETPPEFGRVPIRIDGNVAEFV